MLNVGPTAEGTFPEESMKQLKAIGEWMKVNGESVYGTTKWVINHEGPTNSSVKGTDQRAKQGFRSDYSTEDFWFFRKRQCSVRNQPEMAGKQKGFG